MDFWRGRYSFAKLENLIDILEAHGTSYLSWAKSRDVDLHRAATAAGTLRQRKHRPQAFEMTEQTQILAAMFKLMQQHIAVSAHDKKGLRSAHSWPAPETAADVLKREEADQGWTDLMADIVSVDWDHFQEIVDAAGEQAAIRHDPSTGEFSVTDPHN